MRLIDADETIKQYTQIFVEKYGIECGQMFQGVIKQMPTAYDVDKIVEEFEEIQDKAVSVKNEDISIYATGMMGKAIEIVKGGGK